MGPKLPTLGEKPHEFTSGEIAVLASGLMRMNDAEFEELAGPELWKTIRSVAASALTQTRNREK